MKKLLQLGCVALLLLLAAWPSAAADGALVQCASDQKATCERLAGQVRAELGTLQPALDVPRLAWRWVLVDEARWRKMSSEYEHDGKPIGKVTDRMFSSYATRTTYIRQFIYQKDPARLHRDLLHELLHLRCRDEEWVQRETSRIVRLLATEEKP